MTKHHWAAILVGIAAIVVLFTLAGDIETLKGTTHCRASSIRTGKC
jgi:hypothetical protein